MNWPPNGKVLALCGGVGGAKLALGLTQLLSKDQLSIVVNTGDDFEHFGLLVCPDLDTVTYTLSGTSNPETGWGRQNESWHCLDTLEQLGSETWFRLGDRDLGIHLARRDWLDRGKSLSDITGLICERLGIPHPIIPMSDDPLRTLVETTTGELSFQHYFVREQCRPAVRGFRFQGTETAEPSAGFLSDLPIQSLRQCRAHSCFGGCERLPATTHGAGHRRVTDCRGRSNQGSDRKNDGGTRPGSVGTGCVPSLWRSS
jgi:LPPG:FO 2-phospho-L-lactate transferase